MTTDSPADPQTAATTCEHCDDSVPHEHVDEQPLVEGYRAALRRGVAAVAAVGATLAVAVLIGGREAALAIPLGAVAWTVCSALGLLALSVVRSRRSTPVAVIAGAVTTAALTPLLALLVAVAAGGDVGWRAAAGALGWLAVSGTVSGIRAGALRTLLAAHTREGEAARSGVVRTAGRPSPLAEAGWLVATGAVFGLCVLAAAVLPVVVVVLIPLNAALAVLSRRSAARAAAV
jgi:hypothetical protein